MTDDLCGRIGGGNAVAFSDVIVLAVGRPDVWSAGAALQEGDGETTGEDVTRNSNGHAYD